MSDVRKVDIRYSGTLPQSGGKKGVKIELLHCSKFKPDFESLLDRSKRRHDYRPSIPMTRFTEDSEYWNRPLYRVRIGGRWIGVDGKKIAFFTPVEVFLRWMQFDLQEVVK